MHWSNNEFINKTLEFERCTPINSFIYNKLGIYAGLVAGI